MSDLRTIVVDGVPRRLGTLKPTAKERALCSLPVFEDHVEPLDMATIKRIAQSRSAVGRSLFPASSYVRDQGQFGSCQGWASASVLTRARVRAGLPVRHLSGSYLYSLVNGGRDQGSTLTSGMRAIQERGCATIATVAPDRIYPHQYDRSKADREASNNKAFECYQTEDIQSFWTGLCLGFDGVCAIHASSNFNRIDSNGIAGVDNGRGNHAVLCQGIVYAGGEICGDGENSWGLRYGDQGRMLLRAAHFEQTISVHGFYLIRAVLDGDADGPPRVRR